jgi:polysaccharide deacetylase family protein (PEP-CTERM system associated)
VTRLSGPSNAFTVDLEDWYQGLEIPPEDWGGFADRLEVGTEVLLELLAEAGVRATFFVLGHAARQHPALIRRIHGAGHEIGTHGYSHRFVYELGPEEFARDLRLSLEVIQEATGEAVHGHRAPFFSITDRSPWAFEVLAACGLSYDSSVFPVRNYRYGIPDAPRWIHRRPEGIMEFPLSTWRCAGVNFPVGGGAYFRLFPYTLSWYGLQRINRAGRPGVFYIHPWELDPDHPRLDLPRRIALTHYWNLAGTRNRLRRLLRELPFTTMGSVLQSWSAEITG